MSYDRNLRQWALEYAKEGHTLTQTAAVFKANISTLIAWKRRCEAAGNVKIKLSCPVYKKIIPEKHALFDKSKIANMWKHILMPISKKSRNSSAVIYLKC